MSELKNPQWITITFATSKGNVGATNHGSAWTAARQRTLKQMIRNRVHVDEIIRVTGYSRETIRRAVVKIHGYAPYPGCGHKKKIGTLCWCCKNVYSGCSWSRDYIPVEGWDATPTTVKVCVNENGEQISLPSFKVKACPEYIHDEKWPDPTIEESENNDYEFV